MATIVKIPRLPPYMSISSIVLVLLASIIIYRGIRSYRASKHCRPLPPGPPGLPLIGNLHQLLGSELRWLKFSSWSQKYGPLFYLNLVGKPTVVIGNHKVAVDLLEKRARIYSNRPVNIVASQIMTRGLVFPFASLDNSWRRMRKASHEVLNNQVAKSYYRFQDLEALLLVKDLLQAPQFYIRHIHRSTASSFLSILYGLPPCPDPFDANIMLINRLTQTAIDAAAPGKYLVEYFPFLRYFPSRLCKWKRDAENVYIEADDLFHELYKQVETQMKSGTAAPSVTTRLIQDPVHNDLTLREKAWLVGTLYAAGSETTAKQMFWFLTSMAVYPNVQTKAQAEIDEIVGRERLPTLDDLGKLPYTQALVRELLRWRGVTPFGILHTLSEDDFYEGRFLPKGTDCIVNVWALNHDPDIYGPDAEFFRPERHLDESGQIKLIAGRETKDEGHVTFGFGKRICVGRHVASNNLFIQIATILWCFNIYPGPDETGKPMHIDENKMLDHGLTTQPLPTNKYNIGPRFPEVGEVLKNALETNGLNIA